MSFGFSVGDFLAVTKLISDVTRAFRSAGGSEQQYQDITRQLDIMKQFLTQIYQLNGPEELQTLVISIKVAAMTCQIPLERFLQKARRYNSSLGVGMSAGKIRDIHRKIGWEVSMRQSTKLLQAELSTHVSTINMLLGVYHIKASFLYEQALNGSHRKTQETVEFMKEQLEILKNNSTASNQHLEVVRQDLHAQLRFSIFDIIPALKSISNQASQIIDICKMVLKKMTEVPTPDIHHTFFQDPIIVEDALGRKFPVPSEYDLSIFEAILLAKFKNESFYDYVEAGLYELYNTTDTKQLVLAPALSRFSRGFGFKRQTDQLVPGTRLTMAIEVEDDTVNLLDTTMTCKDAFIDYATSCPRPGCLSTQFKNLQPFSSRNNLESQKSARQDTVCEVCGLCFIKNYDHYPDYTFSSEAWRKRILSESCLAWHVLNWGKDKPARDERYRKSFSRLKNLRVYASIWDYMKEDICEMILSPAFANKVPVPEILLKNRRLREAEVGWENTEDVRYIMDGFSADYDDSSECNWETGGGWENIEDVRYIMDGFSADYDDSSECNAETGGGW